MGVGWVVQVREVAVAGSLPHPGTPSGYPPAPPNGWQADNATARQVDFPVSAFATAPVQPVVPAQQASPPPVGRRYREIPEQASGPSGHGSSAPAPAPLGGDRPELSVLPFLKMLIEVQGSDLHCKVGSPPRIRLNGRLRKLQAPSLRPKDTENMASEVMNSQPMEEFLHSNEADFAYSHPGLGRFRVNAFRTRGSVGMVFRRVAIGALSVAELGLPSIVSTLAMEPRGLILVTGPTGSGKSTTMASMIDAINSTREVHIVTIEDPIEVLHSDKLSMINQRELRVDTNDFAAAVRGALRQDPDVILIGEMRDAETVSAALNAAETGHLVLSTLHTADAQESVNRIIDFFPPYEQKQARLSLAGSLRGVLSQRLVATPGETSRVPVMEVCIGTGRISEAIIDPDRTGTINDLIADGGYYGMQTFDQHLAELVQAGTISLDAALNAATNPQDLTVRLRAMGVVH